MQRHTSQNIDYKDNNATVKVFLSLAAISVISTKCIDPWVLDIVVSNTTGNNQWGNYISLDYIFCGLSEQRKKKSRKLERMTNNDFSVIENNVIITLLSLRVYSHDLSKRVW